SRRGAITVCLTPPSCSRAGLKMPTFSKRPPATLWCQRTKQRLPGSYWRTPTPVQYSAEATATASVMDTMVAGTEAAAGVAPGAGAALLAEAGLGGESAAGVGA